MTQHRNGYSHPMDADYRIVKGAKSSGSSSRTPVVATDSAQSKTYIKILYGLGEGEIEGVVNGGQGIYLDDTPILSSKGDPNFHDVTWDVRPGTNDQTYIEGFPEVSNDTGVNVELKTSAWIRSLTNTDINAVRIRLKWGALRTTNASNGDVTGVTIKYAIDVSTDGGAYVEVLNTQISDKTSANYERSHRIDLPKAENGWNVRVRRLTPPAQSDYVTDAMYVASYAEVIDAKFRYPNTALLGLQYDAENFSSVAKIAVRAKGIKVRVPSNYDPVTRQYMGIWDGSFKRAYSNNPAWIYYDICTAKRYGLGSRITDAMLDKASLYKLGQYCDGLVSDGAGGQEPRFTCNVYIQSTEDAYAILGKLAGVFRAISYWDGDSIICDADMPQDVYFNYTNANVINGTFEYSGTRARDRHTVAKVAWDNPDNRFKTEYEFVRDQAAIAKHGVKIVEVSAWGCTSRGQAQRAGAWAIRSEQKDTQTVSFKVGLDGNIPVPGKVISVADNNYAGRFIGGRIGTVSSDRKTLILDRDVTARAGDTIYVNSESGAAITRIIQSVSSRTITVTEAFAIDSVAAQNAWTIDSSDLATRKFRVMTVKQDESHQFSITALEYNFSKFDEIDNGAATMTAPVSIINPKSQDQVKNVVLSTYDQVQQGLSIATMVITWDKADFAVKYLVEWRKYDGSWIKMPITGNTSVEVPGIYSGNYQARVTAISAFDISSLPASSVLTALSGKTGLPPVLAFIRATGTMFGMKVEWGFPATGASDTAYTEIQYSTQADHSDAKQLGLYAYPTTNLQQQGLSANITLYYRGRLVDRIGNIGAWSDWASGTSTANADEILDALSGKITESALDTALREKVDQIDSIDHDVSSLNAAVTQAQKTADQVQQTVNTEIANRETAISNVQSSINQEVSDRIAAVKNVNDGLTTEIQNRKDGDTNVLNVVNTYKTSTDSSFAAVQSSINTLSSEQSSQAQKLDGVYAQVTPVTADSSTLTADSSSNQATSWTIQSAFTDADSALGQRIDVVTASVAGNSALIQSETTARVNADSALSTRIDTLTANFEDNSAAIQTEATARATADEAITTIANYAKATADTNTANLLSESATRANADGALSTRIDTVQSSTTTNAAAIVTEQNARTSGDKANADALTTYKASNDSAVASVVTQVNTLATTQSLQAQKLDGVYAQVTPVTADSSTLTADSSSNQATSWTIQSAFTDADSALGQRIDVVTASVAGNSALIQSETTARVNADSALSTRIDTVQSTFDTNLATVQTQVTALSTAQTSTALQVGTIQTTVNNNTASIQTQQTSINGLNLQYTLKLDSNGLVGGIGIANSGSSVDMIIRANKFAIAPPSGNGDAGKYAFVYQSTSQTLANGTVVPAGLYLSDAVIGSINANKINAESLSAISAKLGTITTLKDDANPNGKRVVMTGGLIQVFDDNNVLRVKLGIW